MKKKIVWLALFFLILFLAIRLILKSNLWVCVDGEWVKQGNPFNKKPTDYCVDGNIDNFKECVAAGNPLLESYSRKCIYKNKTYLEVIENFCPKGVSDFCTTIYTPVCAYPQQKTFSNSCFACQNLETIYWVPGECNEK